jgi:PKD repeat protein
MKKFQWKKYALLASLFVSAFTLNAQSVSLDAPVLVANSGCDAPVGFTIQNYNPAYTYAITPNTYTQTGNQVSLSTTPVSGNTYTAQVTVSDGSTVNRSTFSQTYVATPASPVLSSLVTCNQILFKNESYTPGVTYECSINGAAPSRMTQLYMVNVGTQGQTFQASVTATANGCTSAPAVHQATFVATPETPQITTNSGCNNPVTFQLTNYNPAYTYKWTMSTLYNGVTNQQTLSVLPGVTTYTVSSPTNNAEYTLTIEASIALPDGSLCTSIPASATQKYIRAPQAPRATSYHACQTPGTQTWASLVTYDSNNTLVWYDADGNDLLIYPTDFDTDLVQKTTYQVAQKTPDGCVSDKTTVTVQVGAIPQALAGDDAFVCSGQQVTLAEGAVSNPDFTYSWTPNNFVNSAVASPTTRALNVYSDTDYTYTLTVKNSEMPQCSSTDEVAVTVLALPKVSFVETTATTLAVCEEEQAVVTLNTEPNVTYNWIDNSGILASFTPNQAISNPITADATIQVEAVREVNGLSCVSSPKSLTFKMVSKPVFEASPVAGETTVPVCEGKRIQLGGSGANAATDYEWTPATDLSNPRAANPFLVVTTDQLYTVVAKLKQAPYCQSESSVFIQNAPLPYVYDVISRGNDAYCDGNTNTGASVALSGSDMYTDYILYRGSTEYITLEGTGGPLIWDNLSAGVYTVKAKKQGVSEAGRCEQMMNGTVVIEAKPSPSVTISSSSIVACPGDMANVAFRFQGDAPFSAEIMINGVSQVINSPSNLYTMSFELNKPILIQAVQVQDQNCHRIYDPTNGDPYPELDLNVVNMEDFIIECSDNRPQICPGEPVTLSIKYTPEAYPDAKVTWNSGEENINSLTDYPAADKTYTVYVETEGGTCYFDNTYTVHVAQLSQIEITGLEPQYCTSQADDELGGIPANGTFSSETPGLMMGDFLVPSAVTKSGIHKITYTVDNMGCTQTLSKDVMINMVPDVDWAIYPTVTPIPKEETDYNFCVPDPSQLDKSYTLQGQPADPAHQWSFHVADGVTTDVRIETIGDPKDSRGKISNLSATTYYITYAINDPSTGCSASKTKALTIRSNPQTKVDGGSLIITNSKGLSAPGGKVCLADESATIQTSNMVRIKTVNFSTPAIGLPLADQVDRTDGKWYINPSKATAPGKQNVVITYEDANGCPSKQSFEMEIIRPGAVQPFNLEPAYCSDVEPFPIVVTSDQPTIGHVDVYLMDGDVVLEQKLSMTDVGTPAYFDPKGWGPGQYKVVYTYSDPDKVCVDEFSMRTEVFAPATIDLGLKSDYCRGEVVKLQALPAGGIYTTGSTTPANAIINNEFITKNVPIGEHIITYTHVNEHGCKAEASATVYVHGTENMGIFGIEEGQRFCSPQGQVLVEGYPVDANGVGEFVGCQHLAHMLSPKLDDAGNPVNGKAVIDLGQGTSGLIYTLTYKYTDSYTDANGDPQNCVSTLDRNFQILSEGVNFGGFEENAILCGYETHIPISANKTENVVFTFSDPNYNAFVDNGDGTAVLNPSLLPEGVYSVRADHKYMELQEDGTYKEICQSFKTKAFTISNIDQIADIEIFCSGNNENAVRILGTEPGIAYELVVNGVSFSTLEDPDGGDLVFPDLVVDHAEIKVVGHISGCEVKMSEEMTVDRLQIEKIEKEDITCFGAQDGELVATVKGGGVPYVENFTHTNGTVYHNGAIQNLPQGDYTYTVTDAYGCTRTMQKNIHEPLDLDFTLQYRNPNCSEGTLAVANVIPTSGTGTPGYNYTWYRIDESPIVEVKQGVSDVNLPSGMYKVVVTDINGCNKEETFSVNAPDKLEIALESKVDVSQVGQAEGAITVKTTGGSPFVDATTGEETYQYTWTGGNFNPPVTLPDAKTATQSNLKADNYYVSVTDSRGCKAELTPYVTIIEPTPLTIRETVTHVSCNGATDGAIRIDQVTGGGSQYTFVWTLPDGTTLAQKDLSGIPAGMYVLEVSDNIGNVLPARTYEIRQPEPLTLEMDITSKLTLDCVGDAEGKIDVTINGGTEPYAITWNGVDENTQLSADKRQAFGLLAGTYSVSVTDKNNCGNTLFPLTVEEPAEALHFVTKQVTPIKCHGDKDGAIAIEVAGGTPGYTYRWVSGIEASKVNDKDQSDLSAGVYKLEVTDASAKQCKIEETFEIINPAELSVSLDVTPISCHDANNGALQVTVVGGEGAPQRAWTNAAGDDLGNFDRLQNLSADTYTVTVTDDLGCVRTKEATLVNPDALQVVIEATNVTCNGDANGTLTIKTIAGGSGNYTYSWENVQSGQEIATTAAVNHLSGGKYRLKVTDAQNPTCFAYSNEVEIIEPLPLAVTYIKEDVRVFGEPQGKIMAEADATTGTSPYQYKWLSGASINATNETSPVLTDLLADTYRLQVTDANGCVNNQTFVEITQPEVLDVQVEVVSVLCNGEDTGSLAIQSVSGGNGQYAYLWTYPDGVTTSSAQFINGLPAGDYHLTVSDTDGNTFTRTYSIVEPQVPLTAVVVAERSKLAVTCLNDQDAYVVLSLTGGVEPYQVRWNDPSIVADATNPNKFSGFVKGNYTVSVTDANGCIAVLPVQIDGPSSPMVITETITPIKCYGDTDGAITLEVTGQNGTTSADYTYLWTGGPGVVATQQNQTTLHGGESYTVTVTDAKGCSDSRTYTMDARDVMGLSLAATNLTCFENKTGTLTANVVGGVAPVVHHLVDQNGTVYPSVNGYVDQLSAGTYTYTVTDANGCVQTQEATITQPNKLEAFLDAPKVLCNGVEDGEAYLRIPVDAGTSPITSVWYKDGAEIARNQSHMTNLGAGEYRIEVTDQNGCTLDQVIEHTIEWSVPMHVDDIKVTHINTPGEQTGEIEILVSGGTIPLTYYWTSDNYTAQGEGLNKIDQLFANKYKLTVEDDLGCSIYEEIYVIQPESMTIDYSLEDIKCAGDEGAIKISPDGGIQPYWIEWSSSNGFARAGEGQAYYEITGLAAGQYLVKVTDSKGNYVERTFSISERTPITWDYSTQFTKTDLSCFGAADGAIDLMVSGGTTPYTIAWEGPGVTGRTGYAVTHLKRGMYRATITDAMGCTPATQVEKEITEPATPLVISEIIITDNTCSGGANASVEVRVEGGTPAYSSVWSGVGVVNNSLTQAGLRAGDYTVTVTDANGCVADNQTRHISVVDPVANTATLTGSGNVCEGDDVVLHLNLSGAAPWTVQYTDGYQQYTEVVNDRVTDLIHQPTRNCTFKLLKVVDATGCEAVLSGEVPVEVHMVPSLRVLEADTDCCLGEAAYIHVLLANEGGWTIQYEVDGQTIQEGVFDNVNTEMAITPTTAGTKTYTLTRVANAYCQQALNESFEITAYPYPQLDVNIDSHICEPNPINVQLTATGGAPWNVVYYMNNLRHEHVMQTEQDILTFTAYQASNTFLFESITSGNRCKTVLGREITNTIGMLPKAPQKIVGEAYLCRESQQVYSTPAIEFATSYEWDLPQGFSLISGEGSNDVTVLIGADAQADAVNEIKVRGKNDCGVGPWLALQVAVDAPIATDGRITAPLYVCESSKQFFLALENPVTGATRYEWNLPTGYSIVAGQGTASILVEINEYARSANVSVTPKNHCSSAPAIEKFITIRPLPKAEAGADFTTLNCATSANLGATAVSIEGPNGWQNWNLITGAANIIEEENPNTEVNELLFGENKFRWNVYDGYCVNHDTITVTNNNPGITQPEATELTVCEDHVTLRAPEPKFGKGRWILMSGDGEVLSTEGNVTDVIGLGTRGVNVFAWEVSHGVCSNRVNVSVISNSLQALADAGDDGVTTNGTYRLMAQNYNNPNVVGVWSVVSGSGDIADPYSPITLVTNLAPGVNTLRWTLKGYDCEAYDEIKVRSADEPVAEFNMDKNRGCAPFTVQFDNITIGQADYQWDFGDSRFSTLRNPSHTFEKSGVYTIKLTAKGKYKTDVVEKQIEVLPAPEAAFNVTTTQVYLPNAEVHFFSDATPPDKIEKYYWDFGDGHFSEESEPVYTYTEEGEYDITFIVTDMNQCTDTLKYEKYIRVGEGAFIVFPTAFTPNLTQELDGKYSPEERRLDIFYPIWQNVKRLHLEVFNQWGNLVFTTDDLYQGWNGYFLGQPAAQGTYVYKAEGNFNDGTSFRKGGNILLIR